MLFGGSWTTVSLLDTTKIAVPGLLGATALGFLGKALIKGAAPVAVNLATNSLPEDVGAELKAGYNDATSGNMSGWLNHTKEAISRLSDAQNRQIRERRDQMEKDFEEINSLMSKISSEDEPENNNEET